MTHEQFVILLILARMGPRSRDALFAATNQGRDDPEKVPPHVFGDFLLLLEYSGWIALEPTAIEGGTDLYRLMPAGDAAMCAVVK